MNTPFASPVPNSIFLRPRTGHWHPSALVAVALFVAVLVVEIAVIALAAPSFDPLTEIYTVT
jgi:hypothetical protein